MREKVLGSSRARHVLRRCGRGHGVASGAVTAAGRPGGFLSASSAVQPPREPATKRILESARDLVARGGAAEVSMGDVAARADVSKALVLYHFHDKDSLLLALVEHVGHAALERERAAFAQPGRTHALDDYWAWLDAELGRGDLRILLALAEYDSERVRAASRRIARDRRELAARHASLTFERLALTPRVPPQVLGDTLVALIDGLSAAAALEPGRDARPAFDTFWLALLTLTE